MFEEVVPSLETGLILLFSFHLVRGVKIQRDICNLVGARTSL